MIHRYEEKQISSIWTEENRYKTFLKVELALLKALEGKRIPPGSAQKVEKLSKINLKRIHKIEEKVKHDIVAFNTSITENLPKELGQYFHFGVTSSDIIDTAMSLQIKESLKIILSALKDLLKTLLKRARESKNILSMGRSHGMYGEPISFAHKFLTAYTEFHRRYLELLDYYKNECRGQFSGAMGHYPIISPLEEQKALKILDLKGETVSTQIIPRDRLAKLITINGLLATAIERLSVEIRHLHRSEILEVEEQFSKGQKGSSVMPHKKNPISCENLTGIARILRSHISVALENIVLWHERDISHSSGERLYLPDNLGLLLYALKRLNTTISNLKINKEIIEKRVKENYTYLSSYLLHYIIEKTKLDRKEIYEIVQQSAFHSTSAETFYVNVDQNLKQIGVNLKLPNLKFNEVKKLYSRYIDTLFKRLPK